MPLKLFYITNEPEIAKIAETAGVDRIFIDMEYIGKSARQGGMNTVQCHHTVEDIRNVRSVLTKSSLLVRCNPVHDATADYGSTEEEIDAVVEAGADIIMLPYFKTAGEVSRFLKAVNGRCRTMLLFETPDSVANLDEITALPGIDEVFVGLNDLSLGYGKKFMFELLSDGTVEQICMRFRMKGLTYGFGGIAAIGTGMLPAEAILKEHYRLGSSMVILSRSFCNYLLIHDMDVIREKFMTGLRIIRAFESEIASHSDYFTTNCQFVKQCVSSI
ncbi:MAG: hypothetical protein J6T46_04010, partial [Victivallales bacterium]|nr:hypothetical protein [Victivallales bacterium]